MHLEKRVRFSPTLDYKHRGIIYSYSYHLRSNLGTFQDQWLASFSSNFTSFTGFTSIGSTIGFGFAFPGGPQWLDLWIEVVSCRGSSWKMVVSWSLSHFIPCKKYCSLKWVIFLFHGSTDFMNSWQLDAVEFPANEWGKGARGYLLVLTPQKGGWCQFSMRIGSTCSAQVSLVYTPADLYLFALLLQWQETTL